jgi:hypothetical protein
VGCIQRQRTSQPLVAEKSCASARPSDDAGNAHNHHHKDGGNGAERRNEADAAAQITLAPAEQMRGEGKRGHQQQRVGEVQRQVSRAQRRQALRREAELDQQRPERCFNQGEHNRGHGSRARQVAAHCAGEDPRQQSHDKKEREAAGDAMGELDHRVYACGVL